jgi:predicted nucleotidyltransferase component of viral defense system
MPPLSMKYNNVWGLDFKVTVMDVREICAEKIRAMSDRARYRDFYDLFLLMQKYDLDLNKVVSIISQKEIRQPITKTNILQNWEIVNSLKDAELDRIYYSQAIEDNQIEKMISDLLFTQISRSQIS